MWETEVERLRIDAYKACADYITYNCENKEQAFDIWWGVFLDYLAEEDLYGCENTMTVEREWLYGILE